MDPTQQFEPVMQLKGEMMDFEFTLDMDHRKRRRNRTTQSCLNCHTSKRKCDRKRPCQRCIQLGLTGLCVYEIDDPALRDDPTVDESTRLRNRIAELESLVRELRGKPHPRWADANFCDGDPSEKWHSRASKRPQNMHLNLKRRRASFDLDQGPGQDGLSPMGTPIKSEPGDLGHQFPYRFTPSPDSQGASPYQAFPPHIAAGGSHYPHSDGTAHAPYSAASDGSSPAYSPYSQHPSSTLPYAHDPGYTAQGQSQSHRHHQHGCTGESFCSCVANPAAGHPILALAQQLQNAANALRALPEHSGHSAASCTLMRRIQDLNEILHSFDAYASPTEHMTASASSSSYDALSTPPDSDIITPLSSAEAVPIRTSQLQEWHAISQAGSGGYNPYFPPLPPPEHGKGLEEYHGGHVAGGVL